MLLTSVPTDVQRGSHHTYSYIAAQDPERRPSSRALLAHEFVAGTGAPPPQLLERLADFAANRRPVAPGAVLPEVTTLVPKWDFGGTGSRDGSFTVRGVCMSGACHSAY